MPICSRCRLLINEGARFCPECGSLIACACTCGYQLTGGEKFCPGCGKSLSSTESTPIPIIQPPQAKESPYESAMYSGRLGSGPGEPPEPAQNRTPRMELQPGNQLGDNYRIIRKIGSGGFGDVYEVENLVVGEHQALKVTTLRQEELKSLVQEFRARNAIKQKEHILEAYQPEVITYEGQKVVVYPMELAEKSFREWLNETHANIQGRLEEGLELIRQACQGVQSIHDAGMVHLDLKPENLLMVKGKDGKWVVKVTDFGLARIEGLGGVFMEDGVGTPAYMAPEQHECANPSDIDCRADIYSLGVVIYEMLSGGKKPYEGKDLGVKKRKYKPKALEQVSMTISETVDQCLKSEEKERFQSIEYLISKIGNSIRVIEQERKDKQKAFEIFQDALYKAKGSYYEEALELLKKASELDKENKEILREIKNVECSIENKKQEEKKRMSEILINYGFTGSNIDEKYKFGGATPLHKACLYDKIETVKLLLESGANINLTDDFGDTPLHTACDAGHTEIVKLLLESGANINVPNNHGQTPLHKGCYFGESGVVNILLQGGAKVETIDNLYETPLMKSIEKNHIDIARLLIKNGADINSTDERGQTFLHRKCYNGTLSEIKLLIDLNGNINASDKNGKTPLMESCYHGNTEIAKLLIENRADINATDQDGKTAIMIAVAENRIEVVKLLIKSGADLEIKNNNGETVLFTYSPWDNSEAISLLIEAGANIETTNNEGETILYRSVLSNKPIVVKSLIKAGVNLEKKLPRGQTALFMACFCGYVEIVKLLINAGSNVNVKDNCGFTPLSNMGSQYSVHPEIVRLLRNAGARE